MLRSVTVREKGNLMERFEQFLKKCAQLDLTQMNQLFLFSLICESNLNFEVQCTYIEYVF